MTDDTGTGAGSTAAGDGEGTPPAGGAATGTAATPEPTFTQAQVDGMIESRLNKTRAQFKGFDDFKAKAGLVNETNARASKLETELGDTRAERDTAKHEVLRMEVALEKKLAPELAEVLKGDDKEALTAHADRLLKLVPAAHTGSFGGSAPVGEPPASSDNINDWIRAEAGRGRATS